MFQCKVRSVSITISVTGHYETVVERKSKQNEFVTIEEFDESQSEISRALPDFNAVSIWELN